MSRIARCTLPAVCIAFASAFVCSCAMGTPTDGGTTSGVTTELAAEPPQGRQSAPVASIVLVHGAWADGSSWSEVIQPLQRWGFTVQAVQLREQSLEDDASIVRRAVETKAGPVVVAGHSYGGFVMSEATGGATNVKALVFVAAFAPDEGESIGGLTAGYPTTPAIAKLVVDDHGNSTIEPGAFVKYFAADLPKRAASVLASVQHPTFIGILGSVGGKPGWRTIPSYYQISLEDQVIDPALQRFFAARMGARTLELHASHVSMISHNVKIAKLIAAAAGGAEQD